MIGMDGKHGIHVDKDSKSVIPWGLSKISNSLGLKWFYGTGYSDVVRKIFESVGDLRQFGRKSAFLPGSAFQPPKKSDSLLKQGLGWLVDATQFGSTDLNKRAAGRLRNYFDDPKDDNIWVSWNRSIPWYLGHDKETSGKFSFNWFIYRQSGWDALQELLLWFPSHVAVELPYNESNIKLQRSTMYVGPRDGVYLAEDTDVVTNPLINASDAEWVREKAKTMRSEAVAGDIGFPSVDVPSDNPSTDDTINTGDLRIVPKGEYGFDGRYIPKRGSTNTTFTTNVNSRGATGNANRELLSDGAVRYPDRRPIINATEKNITPHGYFNSVRPYTTGVHQSVDYAASIGTPVVATHSGVARMGTARNMGKMVGIRSEDGRVDTQYAHLNEQLVKNGEFVEAGRIIGTVGDTGNARGTPNPHVHYILKFEGVRRDPETLLPLGVQQSRVLVGDQIYNRGKAGYNWSDSKAQAVAREIGMTPTKAPPRWKDIKNVEDAIKNAKKDNIDPQVYFEQMLNGQFRDWRPRNPQDLWGRPAFKRVTRTHFLDSYHHIIQNNIRASCEAMWNRVVLYYPSVGPVAFREQKLSSKRLAEEEHESPSWLSTDTGFLAPGLAASKALFDENKAGGWLGGLQRLREYTLGGGLLGAAAHEQSINTFDVALDAEMDSSSVRVLHTFQKNIDPAPYETLESVARVGGVGGQKGNPLGLPIYYRIGNSILANGIREMYTGSLTVMLDPSIRPWDRVYLYDYANEMTGVMGVEEVHHHIDFQTGATTTIVPDMVVEQQNLPAVLSDSWYLNAFKVGVYGAFATTAASAGIGFAKGGLPGLAIGGAIGAFAGIKVGNILWFKLAGRLLGREAALKFTGLYYRGKPYVAGMEGARRETTYAMVKNSIYRLLDFTEGYTNTGDPGFLQQPER
jgi:murein DD-endopeptidase MepM/ murein hydrolase activator NlpD